MENQSQKNNKKNKRNKIVIGLAGVGIGALLAGAIVGGVMHRPIDTTVINNSHPNKLPNSNSVSNLQSTRNSDFTLQNLSSQSQMLNVIGLPSIPLLAMINNTMNNYNGSQYSVKEYALYHYNNGALTATVFNNETNTFSANTSLASALQQLSLSSKISIPNDMSNNGIYVLSLLIHDSTTNTNTEVSSQPLNVKFSQDYSGLFSTTNTISTATSNVTNSTGNGSVTLSSSFAVADTTKVTNAVLARTLMTAAATNAYTIKYTWYANTTNTNTITANTTILGTTTSPSFTYTNVSQNMYYFVGASVTWNSTVLDLAYSGLNNVDIINNGTEVVSTPILITYNQTTIKNSKPTKNLIPSVSYTTKTIYVNPTLTNNEQYSQSVSISNPMNYQVSGTLSSSLSQLSGLSSITVNNVNNANNLISFNLASLFTNTDIFKDINNVSFDLTLTFTYGNTVVSTQKIVYTFVVEDLSAVIVNANSNDNTYTYNVNTNTITGTAPSISYYVNNSSYYNNIAVSNVAWYYTSNVSSTPTLINFNGNTLSANEVGLILNGNSKISSLNIYNVVTISYNNTIYLLTSNSLTFSVNMVSSTIPTFTFGLPTNNTVGYTFVTSSVIANTNDNQFILNNTNDKITYGNIALTLNIPSSYTGTISNADFSIISGNSQLANYLDNYITYDSSAKTVSIGIGNYATFMSYVKNNTASFAVSLNITDNSVSTSTLTYLSKTITVLNINGNVSVNNTTAEDNTNPSLGFTPNTNFGSITKSYGVLITGASEKAVNAELATMQNETIANQLSTITANALTDNSLTYTNKDNATIYYAVAYVGVVTINNIEYEFITYSNVANVSFYSNAPTYSKANPADIDIPKYATSTVSQDNYSSMLNNTVSGTVTLSNPYGYTYYTNDTPTGITWTISGLKSSDYTISYSNVAATGFSYTITFTTAPTNGATVTLDSIEFNDTDFNKTITPNQVVMTLNVVATPTMSGMATATNNNNTQLTGTVPLKANVFGTYTPKSLNNVISVDSVNDVAFNAYIGTPTVMTSFIQSFGGGFNFGGWQFTTANFNGYVGSNMSAMNADTLNMSSNVNNENYTLNWNSNTATAFLYTSGIKYVTAIFAYSPNYSAANPTVYYFAYSIPVDIDLTQTGLSVVSTATTNAIYDSSNTSATYQLVYNFKTNSNYINEAIQNGSVVFKFEINGTLLDNTTYKTLIAELTDNLTINNNEIVLSLPANSTVLNDLVTTFANAKYWNIQLIGLWNNYGTDKAGAKNNVYTSQTVTGVNGLQFGTATLYNLSAYNSFTVGKQIGIQNETASTTVNLGLPVSSLDFSSQTYGIAYTTEDPSEGGSFDTPTMTKSTSYNTFDFVTNLNDNSNIQIGENWYQITVTTNFTYEGISYSVTQTSNAAVYILVNNSAFSLTNISWTGTSSPITIISNDSNDTPTTVSVSFTNANNISITPTVTFANNTTSTLTALTTDQLNTLTNIFNLYNSGWNSNTSATTFSYIFAIPTSGLSTAQSSLLNEIEDTASSLNNSFIVTFNLSGYATQTVDLVISNGTLNISGATSGNSYTLNITQQENNYSGGFAANTPTMTPSFWIKNGSSQLVNYSSSNLPSNTFMYNLVYDNQTATDFTYLLGNTINENITSIFANFMSDFSNATTTGSFTIQFYLNGSSYKTATTGIVNELTINYTVTQSTFTTISDISGNTFDTSANTWYYISATDFTPTMTLPTSTTVDGKTYDLSSSNIQNVTFAGTTLSQTSTTTGMYYGSNSKTNQISLYNNNGNLNSTNNVPITLTFNNGDTLTFYINYVNITLTSQFIKSVSTTNFSLSTLNNDLGVFSDVNTLPNAAVATTTINNNTYGFLGNYNYNDTTSIVFVNSFFAKLYQELIATNINNNLMVANIPIVASDSVTLQGGGEATLPSALTNYYETNSGFWNASVNLTPFIQTISGLIPLVLSSLSGTTLTLNYNLAQIAIMLANENNAANISFNTSITTSTAITLYNDLSNNNFSFNIGDYNVDIPLESDLHQLTVTQLVPNYNALMQNNFYQNVTTTSQDEELFKQIVGQYNFQQEWSNIINYQILYFNYSLLGSGTWVLENLIFTTGDNKVAISFGNVSVTATNYSIQMLDIPNSDINSFTNDTTISLQYTYNNQKETLNLGSWSKWNITLNANPPVFYTNFQINQSLSQYKLNANSTLNLTFNSYFSNNLTSGIIEYESFLVVNGYVTSEINNGTQSAYSLPVLLADKSLGIYTIYSYWGQTNFNDSMSQINVIYQPCNDPLISASEIPKNSQLYNLLVASSIPSANSATFPTNLSITTSTLESNYQIIQNNSNPMINYYSGTWQITDKNKSYNSVNQLSTYTASYDLTQNDNNTVWSVPISYIFNTLPSYTFVYFSIPITQYNTNQFMLYSPVYWLGTPSTSSSKTSTVITQSPVILQKVATRI